MHVGMQETNRVVLPFRTASNTDMIKNNLQIRTVAEVWLKSFLPTANPVVVFSDSSLFCCIQGYGAKKRRATEIEVQVRFRFQPVLPNPTQLSAIVTAPVCRVPYRHPPCSRP